MLRRLRRLNHDSIHSKERHHECTRATSRSPAPALRGLTRVMGYHRPVAAFNLGKQSEHRERQHFAEPR